MSSFMIVRRTQITPDPESPTVLAEEDALLGTEDDPEDSLILDWSTETWSLPATATQHPVENGSFVIDHLQAGPRSVTISGGVTGTPFDLERTVGSYTEPADFGRTRILRAWNFLTQLQPRDGNEPVLIGFNSDRLGTYFEMLCTGVTFEVGVLNELTCVVSLTQAQFAFATSVSLPAEVPRPVVAADTASEEDAGSQGVIEKISDISDAKALSGRTSDRSIKLIDGRNIGRSPAGRPPI